MSFTIRKTMLTEVKSHFSVPKRYAHRSSSLAYLRLWENVGVNYLAAMDGGSLGCGQRMTEMPELVSRIIRIEAAMKVRGLIPFVHAVPASSKVLLELHKIFYPISSRPFYHPLRFPVGCKSLEEMWKEVPFYGNKKQQQSDLLSVSYSLTSDIRPLESAASWGLVNHFGQEQYLQMVEQLANAIKLWEQRTGKVVPAKFLEWGRDLIRAYNRLNVGNFYVLGVPPEKISEWMYDAAPYYGCTGEDVSKIAQQPELSNEGKGRLAVMLLARDVLDPDSGLKIVSTDEADSFCKDVDLVSPFCIKGYTNILPSSSTVFEDEETKQRGSFDKSMAFFVSQFWEWKENGKQPDDIELVEYETILDGIMAMP